MLNRAQNKVDQRLSYNIKQNNIKGNFDMINYISEHVTLLQLMGKTGNMNHAVIINGNWIFDSNDEK